MSVAAVGENRSREVRNVVLLSTCLALSMSGTSLNMVVSALTGHLLASDKDLATLPLAIQFTSTMASTIPANMIMRRIGRKLGFTIGQFFGAGAAVLAAYAIFHNDFWLFVLSSVPLGIHNACWQYYRFAAAETASEAFKPRAISYVMAGGVIAAIVGPELAKHTKDLFEPVMFAGSFAAIGILCLITVAVLQFIDIPKLKAHELADSGRPLAEIAWQPMFKVALLSAMVGYAVMSLVMTATPLAMLACGMGFGDTAFVIQWHALGMFAPSFFTGSLIRRFGVTRIIMVGALLNVGCVLINIAGVELQNFWAGLVMLGLGWNFMFVGGTTLLTETYAPSERNKVQAVNDFMVFGLVAIASFSAGKLQATIGWQAVNAGIIVPVLLAFIANLWLDRSLRKARA